MLSDASAADDFLKLLWQKKKLLNTSNFSFCHNVFNSFQQVHSYILRYSILLSTCFQSCLLQICCMWERVQVLMNLCLSSILHSSNPEITKANELVISNIYPACNMKSYSKENKLIIDKQCLSITCYFPINHRILKKKFSESNLLF